MITRYVTICAAPIAAVIALRESADALSMQECSAKYKAAKEAGMKWNDFRKAQCGAEAATPSLHQHPNRRQRER
jgi:hypothetical protein